MRGGRLALTVGIGLVACGDSGGPSRTSRSVAFQVQPSNADGGVALNPAVVVAILDESGTPDPDATPIVTIALGLNPGSGTLGGTLQVTAVAGLATFDNLWIDRPGSGYTLTATISPTLSASSASFDVKLTFVEVSGGLSHTCALTIASLAYCWGNNDFGQLGDGTRTTRFLPTLVSGGVTFVQISAGAAHSCGISTAGAAWCWGQNFTGQVGDGSMQDQLFPVLVAPSASSISAGFGHSCMLTPAGAAACWGSNFLGQLGDGTGELRLTPTLVSGGQQFSRISAGGLHTCAIDLSQHAWCWGWNGSGQLGDSTNSARLSPAAVHDGVGFTQISANPGSDAQAHTCGITTDKTVRCWGANFSGELGEGPTAGFVVPTPVVSAVWSVQVVAGRTHTCALAETTLLYCWGSNNQGELGDGTMNPHSTPTPVSGALAFSRMSSNFFHSCGITLNHVMYCWGDNSNGQLGDGTAAGQLVPVRVAQ